MAKVVGFMSDRYSRMSSQSVLLLIAFIFLPWISVGASYYAARGVLLTAFLLLGLAIFVVALRFETALVDRFFMVVIGSLTLSLLLSATLASENLSGWDIHQEFYIFQQVLGSGAWHPEIGQGELLRYNSVLSIGILPAILSIISSVDGVRIFEIIYPVIFSIVPIVLYKIYRKFLDPQAAFLSVFLFMSYPGFYEEITSIGKQEVAELLLVLLLLAMLSMKITNSRSGSVLTILLTVGLVTAHYSLAYIYLLVLICSIVVSRFSRRAEALGNTGTVLLSFVMVLCWYGFVAGGEALADLAQFVSFTANGLINDFFNPASRPPLVLQALGLSASTPGLLHSIYRLSNYLVIFCIVLGFFVFAFRKRTRVEKMMLTPIAVALGLLIAAALLPYFGGGLNLSRFYHIALIFAAPCFIYGVQRLDSGIQRLLSLLRPRAIRFPPRHSTRWLLAVIVLSSYFLFNSGWVWAVTADRPTSGVLDWQRMLNSPDPGVKLGYFDRYTVSQDIAAARWLRFYIQDDAPVCADLMAREHVLDSYGEFPRLGPLLPLYCDLPHPYVYLSVVNTLYGIGTTRDPYGRQWPIQDISAALTIKNRICSNGGDVIYA